MRSLLLSRGRDMPSPKPLPSFGNERGRGPRGGGEREDMERRPSCESLSA